MKKISVIKLGGSSLVNTDTLQKLATLVKGCQERGSFVVVVHGGGPAINQELTRLGITWQFIDGQRQTTPEMMDVINQVLFHEVNTLLVESLYRQGVQAQPLSGAAHEILLCSQASKELMQVGKVEVVNLEAILGILAATPGSVPVIAPIGFGTNGQRFNVNADWAATQIAMALKAHELIFLTDQNGILDQEKQLVSQATPQMIEKMISDGVISGGMSTKVRAMMLALSSGLQQIRVLHASAAGELLVNEHVGTLLTDKQPEVKGHIYG